VQFAKLAGARVFATAGTENQGVLRRLGVDVAIDYKTSDFAEVVMSETAGKGVDAVFDTATGDLVGKSCAVTRPFGRLATILAPGGDMSSISYKNLTLHGVFLTRERKRLEEIGRLLDDGRVRPFIAETWPLERVADAHERMDSGHGAGKIVLVPK
jgi:NADPH2:quinone reductase